MTTDPRETRENTQRDAVRDLDQVAREGDLLGRSAVRRAADHFGAAEVQDQNDPVELWGRRIGRALSAIAFVGLALYLYWTYVK